MIIKELLCNIFYILLIAFVCFILFFAIKTKLRYSRVINILNTDIEGFSNMNEDSKEDIMKKLYITENDVDIVKKINRSKENNSNPGGEEEKKVSANSLIIAPNKIVHIEPDKVYDDFYAEVYDMVALDKSKVLFEVKYIKSFIDNDTPGVKILDVGCGTGQHTKYLSEDHEYVGLDNSNSMLKYAKMNTNNNCRLVKGDANQLSVVGEKTFSHIACLYFTMYYFKNPDRIFYNFRRWLKKDGILIIHLVDRDLFDPVLNPANPSRINSIQKYADKRITSSIINFKHATYISDFVLKKNNMAEFQEIIRFKDTNVERRQRHLLYMFTNKKYVQLAKQNGFELKEIKSMNHIKYEHNYLFVFKKVD